MPLTQMSYFQYPYVAAATQGQYSHPPYPMLPPQQPSMKPRQNRQQQQSG
ncbi:hypothetical protein A2U01_0062840, partial [Trifolium medium]|nr:hypothetical protein [Trifolium medium]